MDKQLNESGSAENSSKGKVTPIQVAFIVDRYLSDNNCIKTLSVFRTEAVPFVAKLKVKEAPKNLLSLETILDEYITLKEQKLMVEREKSRVETLLQGMQDVMRAYNSDPRSASQPLVASSSSPVTPVMTPLPQFGPRITSPAGYPFHTLSPTNPQHVPLARARPETIRNSSPSDEFISRNKRKALEPLSGMKSTVKIACTQEPASLSAARSEQGLEKTNGSTQTHNQIPIGHSFYESSEKTSSSKHSPLSNTSLSRPLTPPQVFNAGLQESASSGKNSSTIDGSNRLATPEISPINCHNLSKKTAAVSPLKREHCSSPDRVLSSQKLSPKRSSKIKGRLDFNDTNESVGVEKSLDPDTTASSSDEMEFFGLDFPTFEVLGNDFSLSELFVDIDVGAEGLCSKSLHDSTQEDISSKGPVQQYGNGETSEILAEDINIQGPDSLISVKSFTKCINILSPAKNRGSGQEN